MHDYTANIHLNSQNIAADSCCDTQGAQNGNYQATGSTNTATSGLPFTQLILCEVNNVVNGSIPFGGVGIFDPSIDACPTNWMPFTGAIN